LGIYGYRRDTLLRLVRLPVSSLEGAERLEQLRALENGIQIAVVRVAHDTIGVDTLADAARAEGMLLRCSRRDGLHPGPRPGPLPPDGSRHAEHDTTGNENA
jgi:hypothetical protein